MGFDSVAKLLYNAFWHAESGTLQKHSKKHALDRWMHGVEFSNGFKCNHTKVFHPSEDLHDMSEPIIACTFI